MKNPHMRACLAEALEALLPFHKDEPAGLNTLGGYQRQKLFNEHAHRKEVFFSCSNTIYFDFLFFRS